MATFDNIYSRVVDRIATWGDEPVSPQLEPLLRQLDTVLTCEPVDLLELTEALLSLLGFLTTPAGRTDANCWAVNLFMWEDGWAGWPDDLPDAFADILADMAGALHDTVQFPDIAENFGATPEQLFQQALKLEPESRASE